MLANSGISGVFRGLPFLEWKVAKKAMTYVGGSGTGATGTVNLFTVTGDVLIYRFWGSVNTSVTDDGGATTIEVGTANNINALMDQIADATALVDGTIWSHGSAPVADIGEGNPVTHIAQPINDGANIIQTIGAGSNVDGGQIDYYCIWASVEVGANIVAA